MQVVHGCCCGLDVHLKSVAACLRVQEGAGKVRKAVETFGTTTSELLRLHDWLLEAGCTHVAMESTGVYWKPIFNILEDSLEILLVNAQHIKAVPGRKTDVKDCEWIADLLAHGLLRGSFIPPAPIRDLRDLTRYRRTLIRTRVSEINRIHKLLESANIKLGSVATDIMGVSGRAMLRALVQGERRGEVLAELAQGILQKKKSELNQALTGRFTDHHAFLLGSILDHLEFLEVSIAEYDRKIEDLVRPFEFAIDGLSTIPGVGRRTAENLVSEIGLDMSRFATEGHLASWARVCPGNDESAGKHRSGRTGRGNPWLRTALIEASWSAARSRKTYLSARFRRIARRRGNKRAAVAVAHSILTASYFILRDGVLYEELGPDYFDRLDRKRLTRYHIHRLEQLGHRVAVEPSDRQVA